MPTSGQDGITGTGFTLLPEASKEMDKLCETTVFGRAHVNPWKTVTLGRQGANKHNDCPGFLPWESSQSGGEKPGGARHPPWVEEAAQRVQEVKVARIHKTESWRLGESRTQVMPEIYRGPPCIFSRVLTCVRKLLGLDKEPKNLRGFIWKTGRDLE